MADNNKPYFVTSKNFHGDNDYVEWLKEIIIQTKILSQLDFLLY